MTLSTLLNLHTSTLIYSSPSTFISKLKENVLFFTIIIARMYPTFDELRNRRGLKKKLLLPFDEIKKKKVRSNFRQESSLSRKKFVGPKDRSDPLRIASG